MRLSLPAISKSKGGDTDRRYSFSATGSEGNAGITIQGGCTWTATSNANWLTITSGGSGAGNGAVAFSVAANTLGPRTGILTIGARSFIIRQAGVATPRVIRVVATSAAPGNIAVPIEIVSQSDENALGLSLRFDPAQWRFAAATVGRDARNATLHVNARQSANGYVGLAMALPTGERLPAGGREIAVISFTPLSPQPALARAIEFADYPVRRELVDARANEAPAAFVMERAAIGRNRKHK